MKKLDITGFHLLKNENIMYHLVYSEGSLTDQERWC